MLDKLMSDDIYWDFFSNQYPLLSNASTIYLSVYNPLCTQYPTIFLSLQNIYYSVIIFQTFWHFVLLHRIWVQCLKTLQVQSVLECDGGSRDLGMVYCKILNQDTNSGPVGEGEMGGGCFNV